MRSEEPIVVVFPQAGASWGTITHGFLPDGSVVRLAADHEYTADDEEPEVDYEQVATEEDPDIAEMWQRLAALGIHRADHEDEHGS